MGFVKQPQWGSSGTSSCAVSAPLANDVQPAIAAPAAATVKTPNLSNRPFPSIYFRLMSQFVEDATPKWRNPHISSSTIATF
jgi:hypothetical protein